MTNKFNLGSIQEQRAMNKYNHLFNNALYSRAIEDKTNGYANSLINEALALCGHPHYKLSSRNWSEPALEFLRIFR